MQRNLFTMAIAILLAACGGGSGGGSNPAVSTAPATPTGISTSVQSSRLQIDWSPSSGATSYNVYWSDASGVSTSSARISTIAASATLDSLTANTVYFFRISARNSVGESALTAEHSATTSVEAPAAVQSLTLRPEDGGLFVSWQASTGATGYTVFWSTAPGSGTSATSLNVNGTSALVSGLVNGTDYYVTVRASNAGGDSPLSTEVMAAPVANAQTQGWGAQTLINTPYDFFGRDNYLGDAAINDSGVAAVGWIYDGSGGDEDNRVIVNHTASGNWGTEEPLTTGASSDVAVAVTPSGDIFVAWVQYSLDQNDFRTGSSIESRFLRNGAWSATETLATVVPGSGVYASDVTLSADGQDNVIAAWTEGQNTVWVNRFTAGGGWQGASLLSTSVRLVQPPALGTSAGNEAVLVWLQDTSPYDSGQTAGGPRKPVVHASHFDGGSWSSAVAIGHRDLQGFEGAERLRIDVNPAGSAVAAWQQSRGVTDGTGYRIDALRYDVSTDTWSPPETVVARDWQTSWPEVAIDGSGRSIASWQPTDLADNSSKRKLDVSLFDTGTSAWSPAQTVNVDDGVTEPEPMLVEMREGGDVFAVWSVIGDGMYFRRYDAATISWDVIAKLGNFSSNSTRLAMSRNGHSIVVTNPQRFANNTFEYTVYAAIFAP